MVKFKVLREQVFFFPISFIIFHVFSYGIFFFWVNQQSSSPTFNFGGGNLIWFSDTYWVNWATLWVIYHLAYGQRKFKLALCYIMALISEFFFINIETVVGALEGIPLASNNYGFIITRLHFVNSETRTVIHFSIFLAGVQILIGLRKRVKREHLG